MLETFLTVEEYRSIPQNVLAKVENVLKENSDQFMTTKALFETYKRDQEKLFSATEDALKEENSKNENLSTQYDRKCSEVEELEKKLKILDRQNLQIKNEMIRHENEGRTFRQQRDDAVDEKSSLQAMLNRRTNELEQIKADYDIMHEKFKTAIAAKHEALATLDEIQSKKMELDTKEKTLDKERELLMERINLLTNEVTKHSKDLIVSKREHTAHLMDLQAQIQRKDGEINVLLENEGRFKDQLRKQCDKIDDLNARLSGRSEIESQLQTKYLQEIENRTKLADMYKAMSEESNQKVEELANTAKELQKLLSEASVQYEELERKCVINEATYEQHLIQKNETIAALKKELVDANNLIDALKQGRLSETLENLSPHAAAAYNMMKKGLTLTQIYSEYASVSEQLMIKTHDNEQLQSTFKSFIEELEGKAHIIQKRNEDYSEAMETIKNISREFEQLEMDYSMTKEKHTEAERNICRLSREKDKMQKTISDLSRQVCFLLKEVEEARGGEIFMHNVSGDANASGILNSSDIISKKLVTFHDIEELQENNRKLLNVIRDLSEDYEKAEEKLKECDNEALKEKVEKLESSLEEKVEAADRQEMIIQMLKNQLKMFQMTNSGSRYSSQSMSSNDLGIGLSNRDTKPMSIQTDIREIESMVCVELRKELDLTKKQLAETKADFETSTNEHAKNERMMEESLVKCERKYQQLTHDHVTAVSRAESLDDKCKAMEANMESLKTEITALDNRCRLYTQTIGNHEQTLNILREEAMNATRALSQAEVMIENLKRECALLRSSDAGIRAERDMLKQTKQSHAHLLSNVESIKASMDRSESEWRVKMDEKLDSLLKECSALRRRLHDEQDLHQERINFLNQSIETCKSRLEDEKKCSSELLKVTNSVKLDIDEKNRIIEELKEQIKNASSKSVVELELHVKGLNNKYDMAVKDVEHQKQLLIAAKKDAEEFRLLSENMEMQLVAEREVHAKYQKDTEMKISEMAGELTGLRNRNDDLQKRVNELAGINESSMVSLSDELQQERQKYAETNEKVANLEQRLANTEKDLKTTAEALKMTKEKYHEEMKQHTNNIKALQSKGDTILDLEHRVSCLIAERDEALRKAESVNTNWREEENRMVQEIEAQQEKMKSVVQQNELLLNEIEELSSKIASSQRQDSVDLDASSTSDQSGSDNMLQLINYLRREKNLANSTLEVLQSENIRLKSEVNLIKQQLEEAHQQLRAEQDRSDVSSTTAIKHAELVNKVQTLNALTDSNRVLREERDHYVSELAEKKQKLNEIDVNTITPLKEENKHLRIQVDSLQTEITGLGKECTMWRTRVTEMTEKMNKTNSEELKDLKKTLNKEREEYNKTLENLRNLKLEKSKLEDQVKKLQTTANKVSQVEKERAELQKELASEKSKLEKIGQEFEEYRKIQECEINKQKANATQVRSIARKYKTLHSELEKHNEQLETQVKQLQTQATQAAPISTEIAAAAAEITVDEQNRLRQEGRQAVESELGEQIKQLNDEITSHQSKLELLEIENKSLRDSFTEKEKGFQNMRKKALTSVETFNKLMEKSKTEREGLQKQLNELLARESVMKSRISMLEKEKTETQAERDRLCRDVEVLTQRSNSLQRHLHSQQGVKSNSNNSQDKILSETPTANIKPMAGPSSSVTKSQQNQQSVAVTPWRSASEAPLASIRPMSLPTRTAAVLPTSQTSCSASQSTVMVPPQQQLVDTSSNAPSIVEAFSSSPSSSSHSDYNMPSTSSSVSHPPLRQVVVTPTQQTSSHSAESTQDADAECVNQEMAPQTSHLGQQSSQVSQNQSAALSNLTQIMATPTVSQSQMPTVALVLPRIDLQNIQTAGGTLTSNSSDLSAVASSQNNIIPLVSASNQTDSPSSAAKRTESYYQQDNEDSNLGQVSASNQRGQQQAVVASSIETAPEQSVVIASSQQAYDKTMVESSAASSNSGSSNTVTTTQAGLKRARETDGESSKSGSNTETTSVLPQVKRSRRMEPVHEDLFRSDIDETNSSDMLLKYRGLDVEYQVPTSSQRDQEFDNLVIDSEAEDEPEEDEQAMPDDGIIDENDDGPDYVEDEEEVENEECYETEDYAGEEQDTTMTSYNIIEGPDIDEEAVQIQDQDNEVEIIDEESNEVPNQSTRSDSSSLTTGRRNIEQSSEATSSGNNMRAQSANITSNQPAISLQFGRRTSGISPLHRQQNQQLLLSQGFEENVGDDGIVPSTPTLCVPRRTDGFGEAVSSPQVPSAARFTFADNPNSSNRAGVSQMISDGIDDTRMDLSQLEENSGTGRSVPSTPIQSSPQDTERIEIGQSGEDGQQLNEELSSNSNQAQQLAEDVSTDGDSFQNEAANNVGLEVSNDPNNVIDETSEAGRDTNADVTSDSGASEPSIPGTSQSSRADMEEGREAEALTKINEIRFSPQPPMLITNQVARRGVQGRVARSRGIRGPNLWASNLPCMRGPNEMSSGNEPDNMNYNRRGSFPRGRKINKWYNYNQRF